MKLNEIGRPARKQGTHTKRVGRGNGSGHGGTACRGHKGQKARAGSGGKLAFEGGQMPLIRRLPKRGFTNIFRSEFAIINLDQLAGLPAGTEVTAELLRQRGLVGRCEAGIKVLGRGELKGALTVKAAAFSESARQKIEAAGGKAEVVGG
jgi:large subunit ribosomal protein L15